MAHMTHHITSATIRKKLALSQRLTPYPPPASFPFLTFKFVETRTIKTTSDPVAFSTFLNAAEVPDFYVSAV